MSDHIKSKESAICDRHDQEPSFIYIEPYYIHIYRRARKIIIDKLEALKKKLSTEYPSDEYGPPYIDHELLEKVFIGEISESHFSLLSVHECLSFQISPNIANANDHKNRPLHYAAKHGDLDAGQMLLRAGANVNKANGLGQTPLIIASSGKYSRHTKFVKLLLSCGVEDVNLKDKGGSTPLEQSIRSSNAGTVGILVDEGGAYIDGDAMIRAKRIRASKAGISFDKSDVHFEKLKALGPPTFWDKIKRQGLCCPASLVVDKLEEKRRNDIASSHDCELGRV
eukprot:CAMPEP_0194376340 /NCGR_PEP_ID=MMETSP0174-20130528/24741_1 /TAXON_ID=216777 /ORGANISM="Proboscia alata, Strain PI-D3" /LENGTH=281 /DNA_ID=CAMNT_0039156937 /DNA_START=347 /DNA_END=1192 /DNA_ORIENTATION=+